MVVVYALLFGTIVFLRNSLPGAFGEELGWRGFLFPVFLHASHNIYFLNVYDPLMARYPLTDFFVTEFGAGLMVVSVLMELYVRAHRDAIPAATPLQVQNRFKAHRPRVWSQSRTE